MLTYVCQLRRFCFTLPSREERGKTAALLDVPRSTLHRWVSSNPIVQRQRKARRVTTEAVDHIRQILEDNPFLTPAEIVSR